MKKSVFGGIVLSISFGLFAALPVEDHWLWKLSFRAGTQGKEIVLDSTK